MDYEQIQDHVTNLPDNLPDNLRTIWCNNWDYTGRPKTEDYQFFIDLLQPDVSKDYVKFVANYKQLRGKVSLDYTEELQLRICYASFCAGAEYIADMFNRKV